MCRSILSVCLVCLIPELLGCHPPLRQGDFTTHSLSPRSSVSLGWAAGDRSADIKRINTLVIVPTDVTAIRSADLAGMSPSGLARTYQDILADDLKAKFKDIKKVEADDPRLTRPSAHGDVAVLETKCVALDPGSVLKRVLLSFGSGATNVQIDGRLRMLESTEPLTMTPLLEWSDRTGSWFGADGPVTLVYGNLCTLSRRTAEFIESARGNGAFR